MTGAAFVRGIKFYRNVICMPLAVSEICNIFASGDAGQSALSGFTVWKVRNMGGVIATGRVHGH